MIEQIKKEKRIEETDRYSNMELSLIKNEFTGVFKAKSVLKKTTIPTSTLQTTFDNRSNSYQIPKKQNKRS